MSIEEQLRAGCEALNLGLTEAQRDRLLRYIALMNKWNKVYNLTAIRDEAGMVTQHLLDSLAIAPFVGEAPLLDVGSGAGLPGIPLAIAHPTQSIMVLDSSDKKCAFMRQAVSELGLKNVSVCSQRVEEWKPSEAFSLIVSRAFAELKDFVEWTAHLLAPAGQLLAMKGQFPAEEIERLPAGFAVTRTERLSVPDLGAERHLIWIARA